MDKKLVRDAQLKVNDARNSIQAIFDNVNADEADTTLLEEILETLDALESSIEKLATEQE